ncbi:hypothetical protein MASR1M60_14970 [Rhodocyclaceae bacterium]
MAHALIPEDRIEFGCINPLIGGDLAETLRQVRAAVAFIGQSHADMAMSGTTIGTSPDAHHGESLLCACVDIALRVELEIMAATHDFAK